MPLKCNFDLFLFLQPAAELRASGRWAIKKLR